MQSTSTPASAECIDLGNSFCVRSRDAGHAGE